MQWKKISIEINPELVININTWLQQRSTVIDAIKTYKTEAGVSVLDGKLRSSLFVHFMRQRTAMLQQTTHPLSPELQSLLQKHLTPLKKKYHFNTLLVIPSRTWAARAPLATWLSRELDSSRRRAAR